MTRPTGTVVRFEPRVLWDAVKVRPTTTAPVQVKMGPRSFYNGTRRPITIQFLILSPLGYTLDGYVTPPLLPSAVTYRNTMAAILAGCEVRVTAPGRKHLSRKAAQVAGYRPRPTGIASPDRSVLPYPSSLLGLSAWHFDFPDDEGLVLPRSNQIQFDLSGYNYPNAGVGAPTPAVGPGSSQVVHGRTCFYQETETHWRQMARCSDRLEIQPKVPLDGTQNVYPATAAPTFPDGYGFGAPAANGGPQPNNTFDKFGIFGHRLWQQLESNMQSDLDRFTGFAVALDQIDLDHYMQGSAVSQIAGNPLAPLAQRTALRARTLAGGTGEWWFYAEGAPVSLCCPTINEVAIVHYFDKPFTLDPNAGLKMEIVVPGGFDSGQGVFPGIYNIGASVGGFAIVED